MSDKKDKKKNGAPSTVAEKTAAVKEKFPHGFETMEVETTNKAKYHLPNKTVTVGRSVGEKMIKRGWAKELAMLLIFALSLIAVDTVAQGVSLSFYNTTYGAAYGRDTVTNAGTGSVRTAAISGGGTTTTIVADIDEVSGTAAGTLTLYGSLDGTNFVRVNTVGTVTAVPTQTIADNDGRYSWTLSGSPFRFYRIDAAGGTTVVYYLDAQVLKH